MESPLIELSRLSDPKSSKRWLWACGTFRNSPAIAYLWLFTRWFCLLVILIGCQPNTKPSPPQPSSTRDKDASTNVGAAAMDSSGLNFQWDTDGPPLIWTVPIGTGYSSPVGTDDQVMVHHRLGDFEVVSCFETASGQLVWETKNPTSFKTQFPTYTSGPIPTPVLTDHQVITVGAQGYVQCLDLTTGNRLWEWAPDPSNTKTAISSNGSNSTTNDLSNRPPFGTGSSPIVVDNLVLVASPVQSETGSLIAFDLTTGIQKWTIGKYRSSYASPVLAEFFGKRCIVYFHDQGLSLFSWDNQTELWMVPFRANVVDSENAVTPIILDNRILISAYAMGGLLLEVAPDLSYRQVWQSIRNLDSQYTNIVADNNHLFGFSARTKRFHIVDQITGEIMEKIKLPVTRGMIARHHNYLIILGDTGQLLSLDISDPANLKQISTSKPLLQPKTFCTPLILDRQAKLYLRDQTQLRCYAITGPE